MNSVGFPEVCRIFSREKGRLPSVAGIIMMSYTNSPQSLIIVQLLILTTMTIMKVLRSRI